MLDSTALPRALRLLGGVLQERGLSYELVAAGGSALLLLGLLQRPTRDLDVVALVEGKRYIAANPLPPDLLNAVRDVGDTLGLGDDWLNPGPASLLELGLPEGFAERVETRRFGRLTLHLASRSDQICFKVYAATDQGPDSKHFDDLNALGPTKNELIEAARWARTHDPSEGFRGELIALLRVMGIADAAQVV
jgi:hypothetical protein